MAKRAPPADPDCSRDLGEVKGASPSAFACVEKCLDIEGDIVAGLCAAGCLQDPKLDALGVARSRKQLRSWTEGSLETATGTVERHRSEERIPFELQIPKSFRKDSDDYGDASFVPRTSGLGTSVTISGLVHPLPKALEMAKLLGRTIVEQRGTEDAYTLLQKTDVVVEVLVRRGDISCDAQITSTDAPNMADVLLPWLARICESARIKETK